MVAPDVGGRVGRAEIARRGPEPGAGDAFHSAVPDGAPAGRRAADRVDAWAAKKPPGPRTTGAGGDARVLT